MGNSFLTLKSIARETLPRLVANLVMPNLCYRDLSNTYSDLGDTIQVRKPTVLTAADFTQGTPVNRQDITETSVDVKLDKIATVDVQLTAAQAALNFSEEKFIKDFVEPAAVALAEKINKTGLGMWKEIPNYVGTGSTPNSIAAFTSIRKALNDAKAPMRGRRAIWDTAADAAFLGISGLTSVADAGTVRALREGEIGRIFGIDNYMAQDVAVHTGGTMAGSTKVDNASGYAAGATTIHVDGSTSATATLKAGDTMKIGGHCYIVKTDVTFASNEGDVAITTGLVEAVSDNDDVTFICGGTQNIAFCEPAIAFVSRPLAAPHGVDAYTIVDPSGFSLRIVRDYDSDNKVEKASMDVLYNFKVIYPELAVRYIG